MTGEFTAEFDEVAFAREVVQAMTVATIDRSTNQSARSQQSQKRLLGVSDVGNCREYVRRVIVAEDVSQTPHAYDLAAFVGTAVGDHIENAVIDQYPGQGWTKQAEVTVRLEVRGWVLAIPGHPDLFNRNNLIDFKTRDGLGVVRKAGPTDQERFQRALYASALIADGRMDEKCWLHNVYLDRSGQDTVPVVWTEQYDWHTVVEASEWLADVIYAVENGEESMRDKPRDWCWAACPFAPRCRGDQDSDVEGRITDPVFVDAVRVYRDSMDKIKALEKDKKSAQSVLLGVSGLIDNYRVRTVEVGPTVIPEQERAGFRRLDVRPIRERKPE
jgi:hypothetical protein